MSLARETRQPNAVFNFQLVATTNILSHRLSIVHSMNADGRSNFGTSLTIAAAKYQVGLGV